MKFATSSKDKKEGKQDQAYFFQYFHLEGMLVIRFSRWNENAYFLNTACFLDFWMPVVVPIVLHSNRIWLVTSEQSIKQNSFLLFMLTINLQGVWQACWNSQEVTSPNGPVSHTIKSNILRPNFEFTLGVLIIAIKNRTMLAAGMLKAPLLPRALCRHIAISYHLKIKFCINS